jgi:hypothetical protein
MREYSLRFIGRSIIGASLLALAIPAQAGDNPPEVTTTVASAAEGGKSPGKEEKLICKRIYDSTSRMKSVRACHTKAGWKKLEDGEF